MTLTMTPDKIRDWVNELFQKNKALEEKVKRNCVLEEEVKTLTLKNTELMAKVDSYERNGDIRVKGQEEKNPVGTKLEEELKYLKLENLELTVRFQMKKMWEFVLEELEKRNEKEIGTESDIRRDQPPPPALTSPLEIKMTQVARILMGHVKAEDLLNCRQVCKLWNQEVKHHMEEKLTFHIYGTRLGQIDEFLECARQSFPTFRNLKLKLSSNFWESNKVDVIELFNKHGKSLHKLQLHFTGSGFEQNWNLFEFRDIFLNSLEEIRELKIRMSCRLVHEYRLYYSPHVIKMLPNLGMLSIGLNCTNCNLVHLSYDAKTQVFMDLLRLLPNLETLHWRMAPDI